MAGKGSLGDLLAKAGLEVRDATAASGPGPARMASSGVEVDDRADDADRASARGAGAAGGLDLAGAGKLVVRRERKGRGGKTVTVIEGLPFAALPEFARALKKSLGCGATVEDRSLVLLGDLGERAREWLAARGARRVVVGS